jgi:pre-mRNA-splicing helicase BRR2
VTCGRKLSTRLEYTMPSAGKKTLTLYLMSDSYVGVDQAPAFEIDVAEGEEEEDEEEGEEEGDAMEE